MGSPGFCRLIQRSILPVSKFSSATEEPFHRLHHAFVPALLAMTVYGKALGTNRLRLTSKDCWSWPELTSRSTTLSERLLATSRRCPVGYGGAVPGGVFRIPNATSFPAASPCGGILMNRSFATCPAENLYTAIP